jgi:hypothetical protein
VDERSQTMAIFLPRHLINERFRKTYLKCVSTQKKEIIAKKAASATKGL